MELRVFNDRGKSVLKCEYWGRWKGGKIIIILGFFSNNVKAVQRVLSNYVQRDGAFSHPYYSCSVPSCEYISWNGPVCPGFCAVVSFYRDELPAHVSVIARLIPFTLYLSWEGATWNTVVATMAVSNRAPSRASLFFFVFSITIRIIVSFAYMIYVNKWAREYVCACVTDSQSVSPSGPLWTATCPSCQWALTPEEQAGRHCVKSEWVTLV